MTRAYLWKIAVIILLFLSACGNPTPNPHPTVTTLPTDLPTATYLPNRTKTGFYWPTGKEINSGNWKSDSCGTNNDYFKGLYHIGVDISADLGGPVVYAIADGKVLDRSRNGWENNNIALLIEHRLADCTPFLAVYGHVLSKLQKGDFVKAGDVIATIGKFPGVDHLHFGTSYDTSPRNNLGNMECKYWDDTNGFENPIEWITSKYPGVYSKQGTCIPISTPTNTPPAPVPTPTRRPVPTLTVTPPPGGRDLGKWIAYVGPDENIWLVDLAGNRQQITFDGVAGATQWNPVIGYRNLKWSPDGSMLGTLRIDREGTNILAIRISDSQVFPLISNTEGSFDWLPDSQSIIFSTIPYQDKTTSPGGLSLYNIDSGEIRQFIETQPDRGLVRPDWSVQGDHVFFSIQPAPVPNVIWGDTLGLIDNSGKGLIEVQNSAFDCDWNPDGQSFVCRSGSGEILCSNLVIYSMNGTKQSEITPGIGCTKTNSIHWSPDGNLLAFWGEIGNQSGIFVIQKDGSGLIYLGQDVYYESGLEWSPDSKELAFLSNRKGNIDVYIVDIEKNHAINLTNTPGDERGLAWQPGSINLEILPTPSASVHPSELDLLDPESIVYWLAHDMANGQTDSFNQVITGDSILYGLGAALHRDPMDKLTFIEELEKRIQNKPTCVGYDISDNHTSIILWTKNWIPLWDDHGKPESEEMTFQFFLHDGQVDTWAYFAPSSAILELPSVRHKPCPFYEEETINTKLTPESYKKYARITNQVAEVNLRSTPGYVNKDDFTDVIVKIPSGELVEIIGGSEEKDGLTWWNITWNSYEGWIADHTGSGLEVMDFS